MRAKMKLCVPISDDEFSLMLGIIMNPLVKLLGKIDSVGNDMCVVLTFCC